MKYLTMTGFTVRTGSDRWTLGYEGENNSRTLQIKTTDDLTDFATVNLLIDTLDCGAMMVTTVGNFKVLSMVLTAGMLGEAGKKTCQLLMMDSEGTVIKKTNQFQMVVNTSNTVDGMAPDSPSVIIITDYIEEKVNEHISDEFLEGKINDWLDDHPEATTTVQDGSLTEAKFSNALKLKTIKDYVTPEMFGAVGDGVTDDTTAVRNALKHSIDNKCKLLLVGKYYITTSLLTSSDYSDIVVLNLEGVAPLRTYKYTIDDYGGILFKNGINIFDGITIRGSMYRISFMPESRTQTGAIFYNCVLSSFIFDSCSVSNILAFCHNTNVNSVTQIKNSKFLTVYFFAKCDSVTNSYRMTDSTISGCYINGGAEMTNNHCFEWNYFNGSSVVNNFIDYYQTIYCPKSPSAYSFQGGISMGNQYQVFRYLYYIDSPASGGMFASNGDCFNWNDPTESEKLSTYDVYKYTGHDGNEHDIPPFILMADQTLTVKIKDAVIQSDCKNLIFIRKALTGNINLSASFSCILYDKNLVTYENSVTHADSFWNNGANKLNTIDIPFIKELQSVPALSFGWSDYYLGEKIRVNNRVYRFVALYDSNTSDYVPTWEDITAYIENN